MTERQKNLEAQNEIYKGLFRMPFAFLSGGPFGLLANAAYSIYKVKMEIGREKAFEEWLDTQFVHEKSYHEKMFEFKENEEKKKNDKIHKLLFLNNVFKDADDPTVLYKCYNYQLDQNRISFRFIPKKSVVNGKLIKIKDFIGTVYDINEFIMLLLDDYNNGNIGDMIVIKGKNRTKYIYRKNDGEKDRYSDKSWVLTIQNNL